MLIAGDKEKKVGSVIAFNGVHLPGERNITNWLYNYSFHYNCN